MARASTGAVSAALIASRCRSDRASTSSGSVATSSDTALASVGVAAGCGSQAR